MSSHGSNAMKTTVARGAPAPPWPGRGTAASGAASSSSSGFAGSCARSSAPAPTASGIVGQGPGLVSSNKMLSKHPFLRPNLQVYELSGMIFACSRNRGGGGGSSSRGNKHPAGSCHVRGGGANVGADAADNAAFWSTAFTAMKEKIPDMGWPDMAAVAMASCKLDVGGGGPTSRTSSSSAGGLAVQEAFFEQLLLRCREKLGGNEVAGLPRAVGDSDLSARRAPLRDVAHLAVAFSHINSKALFHTFMEEVCVPGVVSFHKMNSSNSTSTEQEGGTFLNEDDSDAHKLDANTVSRLLTSFSKLEGDNLRRCLSGRPEVRVMLEEAVETWQSEFYPRELCAAALGFSRIYENLLNGSAGGGSGFLPVSDSVSGEGTAGGTACNSQEQVRKSADRIFRTLRDRCMLLLPEFNSQDVANIANAFVRYDEKVSGSEREEVFLVDGAASGGAGSVDLFSSSTTASGPSKIYRFSTDEEFLAGISGLFKTIASFEPQHLANLIWVFGRKIDRFDLGGGDALLSKIIDMRKSKNGQNSFKRQELVNVWTVVADKRPEFAARELLPMFFEMSSALTRFGSKGPSTPSSSSSFSSTSRPGPGSIDFAPIDLVPILDGVCRIQQASATDARRGDSLAGGSGTKQHIGQRGGAASTISPTGQLLSAIGERVLSLFRPPPSREEATTDGSSSFPRGKKQHHLDPRQIVFVYLAFAKLPNDGGWTQKLAGAFLETSPGGSSGTTPVASLSANQLALLLNATTLRLRADVPVWKGSLAACASGAPAADVSASSSSSSSPVTPLLALSDAILAFLCTGKWPVVQSSGGKEQQYPLSHIEMRKLLIGGEHLSQNSFPSSTLLGLTVSNLVQSLQFLSEGYENPTDYFRSGAPGPQMQSGATSSNQGAQLKKRLLKNLTSLTLEDSHLFASSHLVHSVYAILQLYASEQTTQNGGKSMDALTDALVPLSQQQRLLERLSSVCVESLRANEVVSCVNCLAICGHLDEALLDRCVGRFRKLLEAGDDVGNNDSRPRVSMMPLVWQFASSLAKIPYRDGEFCRFLAEYAMGAAEMGGSGSGGSRGSTAGERIDTIAVADQTSAEVPSSCGLTVDQWATFLVSLARLDEFVDLKKFSASIVGAAAAAAKSAGRPSGTAAGITATPSGYDEPSTSSVSVSSSPELLLFACAAHLFQHAEMRHSCGHDQTHKHSASSSFVSTILLPALESTRPTDSSEQASQLLTALWLGHQHTQQDNFLKAQPHQRTEDRGGEEEAYHQFVYNGLPSSALYNISDAERLASWRLSPASGDSSRAGSSARREADMEADILDVVEKVVVMRQGRGQAQGSSRGQDFSSSSSNPLSVCGLRQQAACGPYSIDILLER